MTPLRLVHTTLVVVLLHALVAPGVSGAVETKVSSPLEPVVERTLNEGVPPLSSKIKKIAIGSTGATVTLSAGDEVQVDLTGLTGAQGGTDYLGLGMLLFGLSVLTRMLTTVSRLVRPVARIRPRAWDE